jgi:hypothetical protein
MIELNPADMTPVELVEAFASVYKIHSNGSIARRLKAGSDEILRRLEREAAMRPSENVPDPLLSTEARSRREKALEPFRRIARSLRPGTVWTNVVEMQSEDGPTEQLTIIKAEQWAALLEAFK